MVRLSPSLRLSSPLSSPLSRHLDVSYVQRSKSRLSLGLTNNALGDIVLVRLCLLSLGLLYLRPHKWKIFIAPRARGNSRPARLLGGIGCCPTTPSAEKAPHVLRLARQRRAIHAANWRARDERGGRIRRGVSLARIFRRKAFQLGETSLYSK